MPQNSSYDAVVVGSGPNGLAAAITLARAGRSVLVLEAAETIGGGMRTAELTAPGFLHDVCSAIHPLAVASPFFRDLDLGREGLEWVYPPLALAHPLDDGTAATLERSVEATAESLGEDAAAYRELMAPLVDDCDKLTCDLLGPLRPPRHPLAVIRFGPRAVRSATGLADRLFQGDRARALIAGLGAHSVMPLERPSSAAIGLVLAVVGHDAGWPIARGGSQKIAGAMSRRLLSLIGEIETGRRVDSLDDLPGARALLLDLTPREIVRIAGHRLPARYREQLENHRYGPGAFKVDWALDGPIPWRAAACSRAGTVHVGGTLEEIAAAERAAGSSEPPERPFLILAQQSLFDPTRAPAGKHTAWAYCHVPNGSAFDMTDRIEAQVERFAPGFGERILARHVMSPEDMEGYNPNYVGGDIAGGAQDFWQLFVRPALLGRSYSTPVKGLYVCSSSTPPGGGVHGMCGYHAARAVLRDMF